MPSDENNYSQPIETNVVEPDKAERISDSNWELAANQWINDHLRNSPLAQATEAWNHVIGSIPKLRDILRNVLK